MRHKLTARAVSIATATLLTASCHAGSVARAPTGAPTAATAATHANCGTKRRFLPAQSDLQGFTQFVEYAHMPVPGTSFPGHPTLFQEQYVCGEFYGFIANIALTGAYRQENNEQARKLGYTLGKWPLVPLAGQIVRQNKHRVLEIYAGLFQFKSTQAVEQFVEAGKPIKVLAGLAQGQEDRQISVSGMLPGTLVTMQYEGTDPSSDEHGISVRAPIGNYVLTLSIQGGTDLDWSDVLSYWTKTNELLKPLESRR